MLSNFGGIGELDAEQPGGVGIGIERIRCAEGGLTDVHHFAGNRRVDTCNYPYSKLAIGHVQREIAVTLWRNHRSRWGEIRKWAKKIRPSTTLVEGLFAGARSSAMRLRGDYHGSGVTLIWLLSENGDYLFRTAKGLKDPRAGFP